MTHDFNLINQGTISLLLANTDEAREWVKDNIGPDVLIWHTGIVIERRCVADIVNGITNDGLTVETD